MEGLTQAELATRAGTSEEAIRRLVALGIVLADEDGTYRVGNIARVRLAGALESSGISLNDIARAVSDGFLSLSFLDLVFTEPVGHIGLTYREMCERTGLSFEFVERTHEALGLPQPQPEALVRDDDAQMFPVAQFSLGLGLTEEQVTRVLRVYGENLARVAQAEAQFFQSYIEEPLLRSGMSELQMLQTGSQISPQLRAMVEQMVMWIYHRHQEHEILDHVVGLVEDALDRVGRAERRQAAPPAMMFLDLSGYTRLTEERGDEAAAELATSLAQLVQRGARRHGGRPVKWLGDGVMFHFPEPARAVRSALELVEEAPAAGMPPAHVGVHAGPVIFRDGDYFGRTVNIASRIASKAGPGEVLASESVVEASAAGPGSPVAYHLVGPADLKGVAAPVVLYRAERA